MIASVIGLFGVDMTGKGKGIRIRQESDKKKQELYPGRSTWNLSSPRGVGIRNIVFQSGQAAVRPVVSNTGGVAGRGVHRDLPGAPSPAGRRTVDPSPTTLD